MPSTRGDPGTVHGRGLRWWDRVVLSVLASPAGRSLGGSVAGLRLTGTVTGRVITLPAQYARHGNAVIVVPGAPGTKRWWRNLRRGGGVDVLLGGRWVRGRGIALGPRDGGYASARAAYHRRWPRTPLDADNPVVHITLDDGEPHDE